MLEGIIVKGVGGLYTINCSEGVFMCKPRGIFRKNKISPLVGDKVSISLLSNNEGVIEIIHERKTLLKRPKIANITMALMVFAYKEPNLALDLLDRFTINCEAAGIKAVICFNKIDLILSEELKEFNEIAHIYKDSGYKVLNISTIQGRGLCDLKQVLKGETTVLAGPSGAGKSSIVNVISPTVFMETGNLSEKIRRGKHTTRHTQLIFLDENSYIADSPGFSSILLEGVTKENLKEFFIEFKQYNNLCRFINCSHVDEPGCVVKEKLQQGLINNIRYERYLNFLREVNN